MFVMIDANEFLQGQSDCKQGKPHEFGKTESYDRGYAAQYELEQVETARSK